MVWKIGGACVPSSLLMGFMFSSTADIDNCVSKEFFAYYPHHTTCTLYAADTEEQPRFTLSPGVRKVANFTIPMPALTGVREGEKVELTIKMYFGEVELR